MNRFWEIIIHSRDWKRFYCFPFLLLLNIITPLYQYFSRRIIQKRKNLCSRVGRAKVISIGNITVGGSGKTPIVILLAQKLIQQNKKVFIVHSGYGRSQKKDYLFGYNRHESMTIENSGDESVMMARELPDAGFAIGQNKKRMIELADERFSPDIIIIDDGYQRTDIEKDMDILVMPNEPLIDDPDKYIKRIWRMFPAGILREPMEAIERADAVFVAAKYGFNMAVIEKKIRTYNENSLIVPVSLSMDNIEINNNELSISELKDKKPFLFAGIGSFPRLLKMLRDKDISIVGHYNFGDHYQYDKSDFTALRDISNSEKADSYLTTAKDMVKLPVDGLDKPVYCLKLKVSFVDKAHLNCIYDLVE